MVQLLRPERLADELIERARKFRRQARIVCNAEIAELLLLMADDYEALAAEKRSGPV